MIQIRPVSDMRNKFSEIESIVREGSPVYLTKNGYGSMVVLSIDEYSRLVDEQAYIEKILDEADREAEESDVRLTLEEVQANVRRAIHGKR